MADKYVLYANALTGGAGGALDSIDTTLLPDASVSIAQTATDLYHYTYNALSVLGESSPDVIAPNTGAGRWLLTLTNKLEKISSIAALKARVVDLRTDDDTISVNGYSASGDGGGGMFYWDSSDLSTEVTADTESGVYVAPNSASSGSSGAWVRNFLGPVNVKWFGANGTSDTDAFQVALTNYNNVRVPKLSGGYDVAEITQPRADSSFTFDTGAYIKGANTTGPCLNVLGQFATCENVTIWLANQSTLDGIQVGTIPKSDLYGFRTRLVNCTVTDAGTGAARYALNVSGGECQIIDGKYRGGTGTYGTGIYVRAFDCYMNNPYVQGNIDGVKTYATGDPDAVSTGGGAITAYNVHSESNTRYNFNLQSAGGSYLTDCLSDLSGTHGWFIEDTTEGVTLKGCGGFKSGAVYSDFRIINATNTRLIGCNSSGVGALIALNGYNISDNCRVTLSECSSTVPIGIKTGSDSYPKAGVVNISGCTGTLAQYNRSTDTAQGGSQTIETAASTAYSVDTGFQNPSQVIDGVMGFEVTILWRRSDSSGVESGIDRKIFSFGIGAFNTDEILATVSSTFILSNIAMTSDADATLSFNLFHSLGYQIQAACNVKYLGTGRGYI